jgi:hypothetical protein
MNTNQKPNLIIAIAGTTLVSGIVNLFWGIIASYSVIATIVGVVCLPFTVLPAILGIFEIIYAAKMLSSPPQPLQPSTGIAVFEVMCFLTGNIFSMVVGILSLVFYNDLSVKNYFAELNATQTPPPAAPGPAPALPAKEAAPRPILPNPPAEPGTPSAPQQGRKVA